MSLLSAFADHAADLQEWVPAGQLQPGDWLRTGSGSWVQIQSTKTPTASQRVHNLTVDDLHTYHVVAVETPVLVHNCNNPATHDVANVSDHLDNNVYFHYTSERGHSGIMADDGSLRIGANSAGKIHVTRGYGEP
ncbi:polymorphic toxin-type HINT domain-containing protein [Saccharomonospora xinjiangensis]|uniref:polymorphic toxin-type HINT domain-containing protein n=1 Tax=Saccharomonospora xinjiangensis TaxID=75294 RepID=UPI0018DEE7CF|nr:polymorphic toxin-type HINT domain-containing protein [Saccharomonospora xinjiangensis]